jgi:hypothetical protein
MPDGAQIGLLWRRAADEQQPTPWEPILRL